MIWWGSSHIKYGFQKEFLHFMRHSKRFTAPRFNCRGGAEIDWAVIAAICQHMNELHKQNKRQCHVLGMDLF